MASRLWTITLWKGSRLSTSKCESSRTSPWVSSHLGRAQCGFEFQDAPWLGPSAWGEEGEQSHLPIHVAPALQPCHIGLGVPRGFTEQCIRAIDDSPCDPYLWGV